MLTRTAIKGRRLLVAPLLLLLLAFQSASSQSWELRVCADPEQFPASSRDRAGFENQIAEIVAEHLSAELSYVWGRADPLLVQDGLWTGECDVIFGVSEGTSGLLTTVPYYRVPYVFVQRKDAPFQIESLNDEALRNLSIATYPSGPPHRALIEAGLQDNVLFIKPDREGARIDRDTPILEAVLAGEADLGIMYGSIGGYYSKHETDQLEVAPVSPQIAPPHFQMFRIVTAGVRPGDEALRDRLNIAFAQRWEEIQAVFEEFGVPVSQLPPPLEPSEATGNRIRVGAVLPIPTGRAAATDRVAEAAQFGSQLAENLVTLEHPDSSSTLDVLLASAPSPQATLRAARRLIATEGVKALVGGLTESQARTLSRVAQENGAIFFNIGVTGAYFRTETCGTTTFHVEASDGMYLDSIAYWFGSTGHKEWFLVYENSESGRRLFERAKLAIGEMDAEAQLVGSAEVPAGPASYHEVLNRIRENAPEVVLLLLGPQEQELFASQYEISGLEHTLTGFPHPIMQTRRFLSRLRQVAPTVTAARPALWDTRLEQHGADRLNDSFTSRSGSPMDPSAWAAYASIKIFFDAAEVLGETDTETLVEHLESPEAVFDLHKGPGTSFRPQNHQLRQPLFMVAPNPRADWGRRVSEQIELAQPIGRVPQQSPESEDSTEQLDVIGNDTGRCN